MTDNSVQTIFRRLKNHKFFLDQGKHKKSKFLKIQFLERYSSENKLLGNSNQMSLNHFRFIISGFAIIIFPYLWLKLGTIPSEITKNSNPKNLDECDQEMWKIVLFLVDPFYGFLALNCRIFTFLTSINPWNESYTPHKWPITLKIFWPRRQTLYPEGKVP